MSAFGIVMADTMTLDSFLHNTGIHTQVSSLKAKSCPRTHGLSTGSGRISVMVIITPMSSASPKYLNRAYNIFFIGSYTQYCDLR